MAQRKSLGLADFASAAPPEGAYTNLDNLDVKELYRAAIEEEKRLAEAYKNMRAAELAMLRDLPLEQARQMSEVPLQVHPDLDAQLDQDTQSREEAAALQKALRQAMSEVDAMLDRAGNYLDQAQNGEQSGREGVSISTDELKARRDQIKTMNQLATEEDGAKSKDLSGVMKSAAGGSGGSGGQGGAGSGGSGGGGGSSGGRGYGAGYGYGLTVPSVVNTSKVRPLGTRKFGRGGTPAEWVYVDSWYILGPFDNTGRRNRDTAFPPESTVDLDAVYAGKAGKQIRWEFFQANAHKDSRAGRIVPPFDHYNPLPNQDNVDEGAGTFGQRGLDNIIYYAYTELHFEEAQDLWVAVGSDDASKLWLDGQPVWINGPNIKSWHNAQGYRKVHFKQGRNRLLFRVENVPATTAFSLMINLNPG